MGDTRYKRNANGGLNGFPSGEFLLEDAPEVQDFLAAGGMIEDEMTKEEIAAGAKQEALSQVAILEARQPRAIREALLTGDHSRLIDLEREIAGLMGRNPVA